MDEATKAALERRDEEIRQLKAAIEKLQAEHAEMKRRLPPTDAIGRARKP